MLTIIERKTRYLYASRLNTRKSNVVCNEIINIMKPLLPKSITMDRGKEFANITQKSLDEAVKQINARPRMIFDYKSSEEMLKYHVSTQNCEPILNDCVRHEPVN